MRIPRVHAYSDWAKVVVSGRIGTAQIASPAVALDGEAHFVLAHVAYDDDARHGQTTQAGDAIGAVLVPYHAIIAVWR